jgi:hypothetical protein
VEKRVVSIDRALRGIRRNLTPGDPIGPWQPQPTPTWMRRRVASWFSWWKAYRAAESAR